MVVNKNTFLQNEADCVSHSIINFGSVFSKNVSEKQTFACFQAERGIGSKGAEDLTAASFEMFGQPGSWTEFGDTANALFYRIRH